MMDYYCHKSQKALRKAISFFFEKVVLNMTDGSFESWVVVKKISLAFVDVVSPEFEAKRTIWIRESAALYFNNRSFEHDSYSVNINPEFIIRKINEICVAHQNYIIQEQVA